MNAHYCFDNYGQPIDLSGGIPCVKFEDGQSGFLWKEDETGGKLYICTIP